MKRPVKHAQNALFFEGSNEALGVENPGKLRKNRYTNTPYIGPANRGPLGFYSPFRLGLGCRKSLPSGSSQWFHPWPFLISETEIPKKLVGWWLPFWRMFSEEMQTKKQTRESENQKQLASICQKCFANRWFEFQNISFYIQLKTTSIIHSIQWWCRFRSKGFLKLFIRICWKTLVVLFSVNFSPPTPERGMMPCAEFRSEWWNESGER